MAIKVRKKVEEPPKVVLAKEAEVVEAGAPEVNVKVPVMDDRFLRASGSAVTWMMENRRMIFFVASLIVATCIGVIVFAHSKEASAVQRSSLLTNVFVTLDAPTDEEARRIEAEREAWRTRMGIEVNTDDILRISYTVPSDRRRFEALHAYFADVQAKLNGTSLAAPAALMQAGIAMRVGDLNLARAGYEQASQSTHEDVRLFGLLGKAEVLLDEKKFDEALAVYDAITTLNPGFASFATLSQGQIYELSGQTDKAISAYQSVIRDFGQTADHRIAMARLRLLTADWASLVAAGSPQVGQ
ncbi:MAG: tetratricopeptide repeat protein [Proteobacteria bacterium]|nr:tetratricopeptide repeat protein [Pseudomonadota bacterium]